MAYRLKVPGGEYQLTLTATHGLMPDATQEFSLTIDEDVPPVVVYTDRVEFLDATASGLLEPDFNQLGGIPTPLVFSNDDFEISMNITSEGTLFGEPGGIRLGCRSPLLWIQLESG